MKQTVPVLQLEGVTKFYGPTCVLDGVGLDIGAGEIHALMGENGAGKSTLIKVLTGISRMDSGKIRVNGEDVAIRAISAARRHGIAVVHQELSVLPNLTVRENLFLSREITRAGVLDIASMRSEAVRLLARLGLEIDPETPLSDLDVAERQAVEICRALAENAQILVLDEPTAALTDRERNRLFTVLEGLRQEGMSLLYVSHHLGEIRRLADRVTVLRNGHRVFTRSMSEVSEAEIVFGMLGEPVEELFPPRGAVLGN